ncbi:MAG: bifunctional phosphoribosylaminoimidazolecarboxamide formyltransferase/IMP cyclohydrolase [Bacteroidia bacterium]|nr:bifunctional phosphoribosylaminoimidazolecarboxamide formyltransferase/IMP cyclohydrolase [Bacteroidia bacterium]
MNDSKKIKSAFISVYYKDGLDVIVKRLKTLGVNICSTGGTQQFIEKLGIMVTPVEKLTGFPSILGGRVKTLHPKVFGGILARRENQTDMDESAKYEIPMFDLVIVDLYPFSETVAAGAGEEEIIEKIDIGGISLIRAAAKNFSDVLIISSRDQYSELLTLLETGNGETSLADRRRFAMAAFDASSAYDSEIYHYFAGEKGASLKLSIPGAKHLRYGENPHQEGIFYGNFDELFEQLHGKEISYNNLLDIDAACNLISEFDTTTFAILKHNNACGIACRPNLADAWKDALAGDPVSAYGGILITNRTIDPVTAGDMNSLFFEVVIAPGYDEAALEILKQKKNRIILILKNKLKPKTQFRSILNGALLQDKDLKTEINSDLRVVTNTLPTSQEINDLLFANILVKHTKSNAIVLAKNSQLIASGTGQTSRVDALKQAIVKAENFGFSMKGAVMASDAFFPFGDCVEIAYHAGIRAVIEPGGSVRDQESIDYCNSKQMAMVFTGFRHFKH